MWYAIAAGIALVVGGIIWAGVRDRKAGKAIAERDQLKRRQEIEDVASPILTEPAPTDYARILDRWKRRRERRVRDGGAGQAGPVPGAK